MQMNRHTERELGVWLGFLRTKTQLSQSQYPGTFGCQPTFSFQKLREHNVYFGAEKFGVFTKTGLEKGRGGNRQINKDARSRKLVSGEMSYYSRVGGLDENRKRRAVSSRKRQKGEAADALARFLSRTNRPRTFPVSQVPVRGSGWEGKARGEGDGTGWVGRSISRFEWEAGLFGGKVLMERENI